jgi:hypothetical protein
VLEESAQRVRIILESVLGSNKTKLDFFLATYARALAGYVSDKNWGIIVGERNCGKGLLVTMFESAFTDYIGSIESNNFIAQKSGFSGDEERKNAFMLIIQYFRLVFGNEIKINKAGCDKDETKIDGVLIKKFSSGGDRMMARRPYGSLENFKIDGLLTLCVNDIPEISPNDALDTCLSFLCPNKYVDQSVIDDENKREQLSILENDKIFNKINIYRLRDDNLKNVTIKESWFINGFRKLLFDAFSEKKSVVPDEMKNNNKIMEEVEDDLHKIYRDFKFTDKIENVVFISQIKEYIRANRMNITTAKIGQRLTQMGGIKKENLRMTNGGKRSDGYQGVSILWRDPNPKVDIEGNPIIKIDKLSF